MTDLPLSEPWITDSAPPQFKSTPSSPVPLEVEQSKSSISFINAAAYAHTGHVEGLISFQLSLSDLSLYGQSSSTAPAEPDLTGIPEEYHEFADVFSQAKADTLPAHHLYDLKIDLEEGAEPPLGRMYSLSQTEVQVLHEFLDDNLHIGFIRPSKLAHGAPILFVKKKDGSLRLCIDFRGLNHITKKDRYPLLLISDLLDAPGRAHIYTKIDLRHAYHLVRIAEGDEEKTTFHTHYSSFEWLVIPEGPTNAPSFQWFMNDVFSDMIDVSVVIYLDDILIYFDNPVDHHKHIKEVLQCLCKHGLFAHTNKCEFHSEWVEYLEYILSPENSPWTKRKLR